eukprot:364452-Amorphochlora_amoeboformis.AAC.1
MDSEQMEMLMRDTRVQIVPLTLPVKQTDFLSIRYRTAHTTLYPQLTGPLTQQHIQHIHELVIDVCDVMWDVSANSMYVDDAGIAKNLPRNPRASKIALE